MKTKLRIFLSNFWFIHLEVVLGIFALFGNVMTANKMLLLLMTISFSGAICGAFIRVIDLR